MELLSCLPSSITPRLILIGREKKLLHSGTESVAYSPRSKLQPVASILRAPA